MTDTQSEDDRNVNWMKERIWIGDLVHILRIHNHHHLTKIPWDRNKVYRVKRVNPAGIFEIEGIQDTLHGSWLKKVDPLVKYMLELEEDEIPGV